MLRFLFNRALRRSRLVASSILFGALTGILAALLVPLVLSARALGHEAYAPLSVLWALVFLVGPGFFLPIEQEIGRALAARRSASVTPTTNTEAETITTGAMCFRLISTPPLSAHLARTTSGLPFSTIYVASSAPLPLPTFFAEGTTPAGINKTSPALSVTGGCPSSRYSSTPSST